MHPIIQAEVDEFEKGWDAINNKDSVSEIRKQFTKQFLSAALIRSVEKAHSEGRKDCIKVMRTELDKEFNKNYSQQVELGLGIARGVIRKVEQLDTIINFKE